MATLVIGEPWQRVLDSRKRRFQMVYWHGKINIVRNAIEPPCGQFSQVKWRSSGIR